MNSMTTSNDKTMSLEAAIRCFVHKGCHLSIGGFTINRNPMAAVHEIIRQRIRGLHLYAHSNGQGLDELVGAGCVERLEIAYGGSGLFAPTCVRFRKAVAAKTLLVEDYSNYQMTLRFSAGAMGVPFLPVRSGLGTDIVARWGFDPAMRQREDKVPDHKLIVMDNPFGAWAGAEKVVLVPAINPDVTIIHVQQADANGTVRIEGLPFADVEQARAARTVIDTCEEVVSTEVLRRDPQRNQLPHFCVDAVVHVPMGAYPTACFRHYDYDPVFLKAYRRWAEDEEQFQAYLQQSVFGTADHAEFLSRQPAECLDNIKADPRTGYASGLDRR